jgi:hypothetical protein
MSLPSLPSLPPHSTSMFPTHLPTEAEKSQSHMLLVNSINNNNFNNELLTIFFFTLIIINTCRHKTT